MMTRKLRLFLSHNGADKAAVEALALRLRQEPDLEPWLDKWDLVPGEPWQEALADEPTAVNAEPPSPNPPGNE